LEKYWIESALKDKMLDSLIIVWKWSKTIKGWEPLLWKAGCLHLC